MKKFCTSLREHAKNVINFEIKKMLPLKKEELNHIKMQRYDIFVKKRILKKLCKSISYREVEHHCHYTCKYRGAAHSISNLKFNVPQEIPVVFHNESNYDYHFTIKGLANEFDRQI